MPALQPGSLEEGNYMVALKSRYRTHSCGELRSLHVGQEVRLSGWIHRKRDHGGLIFIDLRDHYGLTQVTFSGQQLEEVQKIRVESVICVQGKVLSRSADTVNSRLPTGEVEVQVADYELLSAADVLPFQIADDDSAPEAARLKHRFLELRREKLHQNIVLGAQVIQAIRECMIRLGFLEYQTPILTSSSPEGARDFLVPSRRHPGKFYALPQAPQQFKQLLMVAGFDRYFQIAPCFRDEDSRADRSPGEFYQLDLEMSFVEQDHVFEAMEVLFPEIFTKFSKKKITPAPFPRYRWDDAMAQFGTDKPDLRNPLRIQNVSEIFKNTGFKVFGDVLASGGSVFCVKLDLPQIPPRKYFDDTVENFKRESTTGLAYLSFEGPAHKGTIAKFMSDAEIAGLRTQFGLDGKSPLPGATVVFFAAGRPREVLPHLGKLLARLGKDFSLLSEDAFNFCWITDYPMYEVNQETGLIDFSHNPFSMPQGGLEALTTKDPLEIYAYQYDLVCNGNELLSGAIRNHLPEIMYKAFEIAGHSRDEVDARFGGMIRAFKFGAPPHGGCAPGIARIVMLLAEEQAIREVIPFPLAQTGEDLMMGAPCEVSKKQLDEVHIALKLPPQNQ